ncbi:winged helix-turn-helix domain-containing protein [Micromonospora sp. WMMA1363]|uniref:GntR family transcriptional regulator n=1 Tax=Micromonospora sp. WMMA1363 TaxID=3053985 RepID=UPI00259CDEE2|nr:winged helix-turn-helix domain-containing protein [Micromonospora sp. WMMA1363]MDM4720922.1 winged helix-turn-helix domain-containing protein [Micromonospora sp. WMMA1363]
MIGAAEPTGVLTMPTAQPSFRRIVDEISEKIRTGELKPGDKLPSTSQLAEMYNVSTGTVYRALSLLHDRELIIGQSGRGTFVAEQPGR